MLEAATLKTTLAACSELSKSSSERAEGKSSTTFSLSFGTPSDLTLSSFLLIKPIRNLITFRLLLVYICTTSPQIILVKIMKSISHVVMTLSACLHSRPWHHKNWSARTEFTSIASQAPMCQITIKQISRMSISTSSQSFWTNWNRTTLTGLLNESLKKSQILNFSGNFSSRNSLLRATHKWSEWKKWPTFTKARNTPKGDSWLMR